MCIPRESLSQERWVGVGSFLRKGSCINYMKRGITLKRNILVWIQCSQGQIDGGGGS